MQQAERGSSADAQIRKTGVTVPTTDVPTLEVSDVQATEPSPFPRARYVDVFTDSRNSLLYAAANTASCPACVL
jgi:hypothetical protein